MIKLIVRTGGGGSMMISKDMKSRTLGASSSAADLSKSSFSFGGALNFMDKIIPS